MIIAQRLAVLRKALDELEAVVAAKGCKCCGSKQGCPCRVDQPRHDPPRPIVSGGNPVTERLYFSTVMDAEGEIGKCIDGECIDGDYSTLAADAEAKSKAAADRFQGAAHDERPQHIHSSSDYCEPCFPHQRARWLRLNSDNWLELAAREIAVRSGQWVEYKGRTYPPIPLAHGEVLAILRRYRDVPSLVSERVVEAANPGAAKPEEGAK